MHPGIPEPQRKCAVFVLELNSPPKHRLGDRTQDWSLSRGGSWIMLSQRCELCRRYLAIFSFFRSHWWQSNLPFDHSNKVICWGASLFSEEVLANCYLCGKTEGYDDWKSTILHCRCSYILAFIGVKCKRSCNSRKQELLSWLRIQAVPLLPFHHRELGTTGLSMENRTSCPSEEHTSHTRSEGNWQKCSTCFKIEKHSVWNFNQSPLRCNQVLLYIIFSCIWVDICLLLTWYSR